LPIGGRDDCTRVKTFSGIEISSRSALRASAHGDFAVRRPRLKIGERAFSVAAPRLWNQLPTELKLCQSTALFKRKLKTFLFTASYGVSEKQHLNCVMRALGQLVGGAIQITVVIVIVSRHQKGKPFWILLEQEMIGWQWHQLDHMQIICSSAQTDKHASTSPLFYRPDALPATQPTKH